MATVVGELAHSGGHLQPGAGGQVGNTGSLMGSPDVELPTLTGPTSPMIGTLMLHSLPILIINV